MKKVLIAPAAFKGTLSATAVARAIVAGLADSGAALESVLNPLADGGDGTVEALAAAGLGAVRTTYVRGPLDRRVGALWLAGANEYVVELASACGIALLEPHELSPLHAHTFGLGQVLLECLQKKNDKEIVIALGGSASTDGGTGALRALGARFYDADKKELAEGGGALSRLDHCDLSALAPWRQRGSIKIITDVTNPLLGDKGAAHVFAPQKGANAGQRRQLEDGLERLAFVLEQAAGTSARHLAGSGAAGGAAFGLAVALGAQITPGFQWIAEKTSLAEKIAECILVVSGEGRLDAQSFMGKGVGALVKLCRQLGKPVWVLVALCDTDLVPEPSDRQDVPDKVLVTGCPGQIIGSPELRRASCLAFREWSSFTGAVVC